MPRYAAIDIGSNSIRIARGNAIAGSKPECNASRAANESSNSKTN